MELHGCARSDFSSQRDDNKMTLDAVKKTLRNDSSAMHIEDVAIHEEIQGAGPLSRAASLS